MTDLSDDLGFDDNAARGRTNAAHPALRQRQARPERTLRYNPKDTRDEAMFDAAARHSSHVRWLKFALPAIVVIAIGVFWASARFIPGDMESLVEVAGIDATSNSVIMQKPHISGFEGTRRAYEVKAESASQSLDDPKVVTFNTITGHFGLDEAGVATVNAVRAIYDGNKNTLQLEEGATVETNTGYAGTITGALIDLGAGTMTSDQPLELSTAEGSIRAQGVSVADRGKRVSFKNVTVTYMPPAELVTESGKAGDVPVVVEEQ